jgi:hypothetical protein
MRFSWPERRGSISATLRPCFVAIWFAAGVVSFTCNSALAAPTCPGPLTSDGLACCAPASTPTSGDACLLPNGQASSCALSQLTSSGTCCPASVSPQPDGTCQANGYTVEGCPLGQLDKGGLTCCPAGQTPQADGSCQQAAATATPPPSPAISACPNGFVFEEVSGNCLGAPVACPVVNWNSSGTTIPVPGTPLTGTPLIGPVSNPGFTLGCCPFPSAQEGPTSACVVSSGTFNQFTPVATVAPVCPPGSTANNFFATGVYFCVAALTCPALFHPDRKTGLCDVDPLVLDSGVIKTIALDDPGSCKSGTVPRRAFAGDSDCVSPAVGALTLLDNIAAPSHTNPEGSCVVGYGWRLASSADHVCVSTTPAGAQTPPAGVAGRVTSAPPAPSVTVTSATYGGNCVGVAAGNVTNILAAACNGRDRCDYTINYKIIGDPARGCQKSFTASWQCNGVTGNRSAAVAPEAGFGSVITLSCENGSQPGLPPPSVSRGVALPAVGNALTPTVGSAPAIAVGTGKTETVGGASATTIGTGKTETAQCPLGEVREDRGCEKPQTPNKTVSPPPLKVIVTPPKVNTVQAPPKLKVPLEIPKEKR